MLENQPLEDDHVYGNRNSKDSPPGKSPIFPNIISQERNFTPKLLRACESQFPTTTSKLNANRSKINLSRSGEVWVGFYWFLPVEGRGEGFVSPSLAEAKERFLLAMLHERVVAVTVLLDEFSIIPNAVFSVMLSAVEYGSITSCSVLTFGIFLHSVQGVKSHTGSNV